MFRNMFCRKGRMALATRNILTSVRPMISGLGHFVNLQSIGKFHFAKNIG